MSQSKCREILKFATYYCLISIIFINLSWSARWANVVVNKAIIYSDLQMTSAIGYLKKGKKVRVGEVARSQGQLLPIVVNQRVAYIKVKDLSIANDIRTLQSVSERIKEMQNKVTVENRVGFYTGLFFLNGYLGKDFDSESYDYGRNAFYILGLVGHHTKLEENSSFKVATEFTSRTDGDSSNTLYSISIGRRFFSREMNKAQIDIYGSVVIQPFIEAKISDDLILNGNGLGASIELEYVTSVSRKLDLHFEGNYSMVKQFGFDSGKDSETLSALTDALEGYFFGHKFLVKLTYRF